MKPISYAICLVVILVVISTSEAAQCTAACTREYNPVCTEIKIRGQSPIQCTFGNPCLYRFKKCRNVNYAFRAIRVNAECKQDHPQCKVLRG